MYRDGISADYLKRITAGTIMNFFSNFIIFF